MLHTTDGSKANAFFAEMDRTTAEMLRGAVTAACARAVSLTTACAVLAAPVAEDAIIKAVNDNVQVLGNSALDVFVDALQAGALPGKDAGAAIAAGAAAAGALGFASVGKVRGDVYRAGSLLGDVEAIASGNPEKIVRRGAQHVFWRAVGRAGRRIFRKIGGR